MGVNEAKFEAARKAVEDCQRAIAGLQTKRDTLGESLPGLSRAVEDAEKAKTAALDNFAMTSNKTTESALKAARQTHETAQRAYAEGNELAEATNRALTKQQAELTRLNNACELVKRQYWQAVFDEIKSAIPSEVFKNIQKLFVISNQTGQTRQFLLDTLFPNLSSGEHQEITSELCEKYNIE